MTYPYLPDELRRFWERQAERLGSFRSASSTAYYLEGEQRLLEAAFGDVAGRRVAVFAYGVACYAAFLATFLYAVGFLGNFGVPKSIDAAKAFTNEFLPK